MNYKEYGANFHKLDSCSRFMEPFIFASEFRENKRFARYVSKIKNYCDRVVRENFTEDYEGFDSYDFVLDAIRYEANEKYLDKQMEEIANDPEKIEGFDATMEDKPEDDLDEEVDNDAAEDEQERLEDMDSDDWTDIDFDMAKFLVRRQRVAMGVEDDIEVLDDIDDNFTYFHKYRFNDYNEDTLWNSIMSTFFNYHLLECINRNEIPDSMPEEAVKHISEEAELITHNFELFRKMVEWEFEECCFDYLRYRIIEEKSTVNFDNFTVHGLPRGEGEALWLLSQVIDKVAVDFLNGVREENTLDASARSAADEYEKKINELNDLVEDLKTTRDKLEEKNFTLRKKLESYDETKKKEFEGIKNENQALYYEKSLLEKKNAAMSSECERLKKQLENLQKEEYEDDVSINEVDTSKVDANKRYIFVMDENPYGKEQLLRAFPNSKVVDEYIEYNPAGVDVVICITSRVKHNVYNATKDYCAQKGIKFLHSVQGNVEMIKRLLSERDAEGKR